MFKRKSKERNVFKSMDDIKKNIECFYLNKYCLQQCFCEKDSEENITKYFIDKDIYYWELMVYLKLLDNKITPELKFKNDNGNDNCITYVVSNKISIYTFLLENKEYTKFILNELYCFVKKFNRYNFLHGNLHLHNIYIDPGKFLNNGKFYIIDFSNSYIFKTNNPTYNRRSFVGDYYDNNSNEFYLYWDFFTLYISLKMFLKNDFGNLVYLEKLIQNYIPEEIIQKFIYYISK